MKNLAKLTTFVFVLAGVGFPGIGESQQPGSERPALRAADDQVEAPHPEGHRQVALLDIVLQAKEGRVLEATVKESAVIASFAPKDFARKNGAWTIVLEGSESVEYRVANPILDVEYERSENDKSSELEPFGYVVVEGEFLWELTVPLYRGERSLGVKSITILDEEQKEVVSVELEGQK